MAVVFVPMTVIMVVRPVVVRELVVVRVGGGGGGWAAGLGHGKALLPAYCKPCSGYGVKPAPAAADGVTRSQSTRVARKRKALAITLTEDRAMAAAATTGESSQPKKGYSTPAARGMPATL